MLERLGGTQKWLVLFLGILRSAGTAFFPLPEEPLFQIPVVSGTLENIFLATNKQNRGVASKKVRFFILVTFVKNPML